MPNLDGFGAIGFDSSGRKFGVDRTETYSRIVKRSTGAVLASAAGDALGAPHEFGPPLPDDFLPTMTGGGPFNWEPAEWTDDTQMALAILTPLAAGRKDIEAVEAGFLEWYHSHPRDIGAQTRRVLREGAPLADAARRDLSSRPDGAGNGGLMRIAPAALAFPGQPSDIAEYARAVTALTHAHPDCLDASVLWALAIDLTISEAGEHIEFWDFEAAVRHGLDALPQGHRDRWDGLIAEACELPPIAFDQTGWVVHAFQAALSTIVHTPVMGSGSAHSHLRRTLANVVRLGGDTDTVAAIAGALLGARWATGGVPRAWSRPLHGYRRYDEPQLDMMDLSGMVTETVGAYALTRAQQVLNRSLARMGLPLEPKPPGQSLEM